MIDAERVPAPPGSADFGEHTVYQLDCPKCGAFCFGVTNKAVGRRLKEHRKDGSAPANHEDECRTQLHYKTLIRFDDRASAERYETDLIKAAWNDPMCLNAQISNKRRKRRGR